MHDDCLFVTLTYDEANLPTVGQLGVGTLEPEDTQRWLKRLRKALVPRRIRYYLCGEYGSRTLRPHYHAILFGAGPDDYDIIKDTWKMGHVSAAEVNKARMAYVVQYTTKKWTSKEDPRLEGRHPEFGRASRHPGLGVPMIRRISSCYETKAGCTLLASEGNVKRVIRIDGRVWPLDRHMLNNLREDLGLPLLAADRPSEIALAKAGPEEREQARLADAKARRKAKRHGVL